MLHVGLDLSRKRVDVCLISDQGELVDELAAPFDEDGLCHLPDPQVRRERELARFRLHLVRHRSSLKNRIHSTLITFGKPCPVSDLFGVAGRKLLERLDVPEPWRANVEASVILIDQLDRQIDAVAGELKYLGADHPYVPLLMTAPGVGWLVGFSIACEIGDINRFSSPTKLCGYTGLCPRVIQSGETDRRGPISKHGPKYLRWALFEAALNACDHPLYKERYERTKKRLGRQRGPKVAQIELSRKLTEAIWHMLTRNQPFAPAGAPNLSYSQVLVTAAHRAAPILRAP